MKPAPPKWPREQIEALRAMAERRLSASEIAGALTAQFDVARSRSAVLGKLFRLREEGTRPPRLSRPPGRWARLKVEAGVRYGKYLVAVEEVPTAGRGQLWRFRCDCGVETVKRASDVKCERVASCGHCGLRGRHQRRH